MVVRTIEFGGVWSFEIAVSFVCEALGRAIAVHLDPWSSAPRALEKVHHEPSSSSSTGTGDFFGFCSSVPPCSSGASMILFGASALAVFFCVQLQSISSSLQ